MDYEFSPRMLALLFIGGGFLVVFILMGGSLTQLFSSSIQESVLIQLKERETCVVEASDGIPRIINNCPYNKGDNITINYKQGLPNLDAHTKP